MNVLIIGSGGYIGKYLCSALRQDGFHVVGVSSSDGSGINPVTGLITERFTIPTSTESIVYLAQSPYYRQVPEKSDHLMAVNVFSAIQIANLARRAKVKRFIYLSTGSVYQPSFAPLSEQAPLHRDNWYSLSKIHAEEALNLFKNDMDINIVRPFGIYGPGQQDKLIPNIFNAIFNDQEIFIQRNLHDDQDKEGLRISWCYIDDAIDILKKLILNGGPSVLNLAGNQPISIRKLAQLIAHYLGKTPHFQITDVTREGDLIADITLLQKTFSPKFTTIEDGMNAVVKSMIKLNYNE
jgi:nucleoside-diphosphate-sugar epimerase